MAIIEVYVASEKDAKLFRSMREVLISKFGYCENCIKEAIAFLLKRNFT